MIPFEFVYDSPFALFMDFFNITRDVTDSFVATADIHNAQQYLTVDVST